MDTISEIESVNLRKVDVVAPHSAPIFAIDAAEVAERLDTPGPKYSNIRPVPP